jgi:hypothetical protein
MNECKCSRYELNNPKNIHLSEFDKDFNINFEDFFYQNPLELAKSRRGIQWAYGTCSCRSCKKEFNWEYEDIIMPKICINFKISSR